ncbi:GTPase [Thiomonas sp. X19]|uniref:tRNA uridine-5-carboxymethylaminomethyl(34) synthesis GTPase MnmE n=1 Tax=Thiomonas sp. X19 TaxID=1050370 RepID=UPI000B646E37|nr:tRNA uridine-5-carboxymethylaminomethyl(34) synthesis GTPase MnmE [Thiomonas sp. X19]SCC91356.1 GTPase [Thiomonas sp. X19]
MNPLARQADPIAAVATAPGRGAVGIVRATGRDLRDLVRALCGRDLEPRHATLLPFRDAEGRVIDTGLALHFPAPHSYTGEDVLELQAHGGPVVLQLLLLRLLELGRDSGLRPAEPGEFTQRAFLNGKLDLAQAEAVADLIDATTATAARSASRSLAGELSQRVHALADRLRELRALVEATLDFPEEDIDFIRAAGVAGRLQALQEQLAAMLARTRQGALLREGLHVVLAGQPNVGKSSLLNALAGAELAIVTDVPGTTRDRVSQAIQIEGVPLHIIDTAGLRDTGDAVERIGVARSWDAIAEADAVVFLHDLTRLHEPDYALAEAQIAASLARHRPTLLHAWNKVDALDASVAEVRRRQFCQAMGWAEDETAALNFSARQHTGLDALRQALLAGCGWRTLPEGVFLARTRHVQALEACAAHLMVGQGLLGAAVPALDLLAEELRLAHQPLMAITGAVTADDLLGDIFSRFCIGK